MNEEQFQDYVKERYRKEIKWYDDGAAFNKHIYTVLQWGVIGFSALIPVLVVTLEGRFLWLTAGLGVILAIGTAGLKTFKFHENWLNYRTIAETLKKEKHFYDAGLEGYEDASNPNALFVDRVEALISRENTLWISVHQLKEDNDK